MHGYAYILIFLFTLSVSASLPPHSSHLPLICITFFSLSFPPSVPPTPTRLLQDQWLARSPMLQRRVYHVMAAVKRQLYVLGGNDLDYNNDRILVRHIDSYDMDLDQWTRCSFSLLTGGQRGGTPRESQTHLKFLVRIHLLKISSDG